MGDQWFALGVGTKDIPGVISTTLEFGGSRPVWEMKNEEVERMLMAWPSDSLLLSSVLVAGKTEGRLAPVAVAPLMEGFSNTLTIRKTHAWKGGHAGEIMASPEDFPPLWFYDPLFFRDTEGEVEGKTCEFLLSGLCYGSRRALLDELTVTEILHQIGVPAHIKGYQYLREAVRMVLDDHDLINRITKELYPGIARRFDTSASKVERAMRHAIEVAWARGRLEAVNQMYGYRVFAPEDRPTIGEFIALVSDKISVKKTA